MLDKSSAAFFIRLSIFRRTRFVNAMKRHSAANFVQQIHVVNSFVKVAPGTGNHNFV